MPNTIALAKNYTSLLDEVYRSASVTADLASDRAMSRAGANAICELLALKKPNLLIPLPAGQSRGDQLIKG